MVRYRDLGFTVGLLPPGPLNAITDVDGVKVGVTTLIEGEGALEVGRGPVRTGVTVVVPHDDIGHDFVFAGCHRLNGNGELTGLEWVRESGTLTTPIAITNTHSVGVVRDALVQADVRDRSDLVAYWSLPVVGETYDGALNDINGFHVRAEHLLDALDRRQRRPRAGRQRGRRHRDDLPRLQGRHRHGVAPSRPRTGRLDRGRAGPGEPRSARSPHRRRRAGGPR